MSLLGDIVGKVLGGGNTQNNLVNAVMGVLGNQQSGGLEGLVQQFAGKGLGDIVNSWVSTGKNLPITPEQLQKGLGTDTLNQIASKAGIAPEKVSTKLSELLPQVVDKLTPNGKIQQGDIASQGMELLKGLLK